MQRGIGAWWGSVLIAVASAGGAEPFIPQDDAVVLESLPAPLFASRDEIARLRDRLAADPSDPEIAASAATRYMQLGAETGDARFYGYARAALGPWWQSDDPPPNVLRLRAKLNERNHEYDLALADLQRLVRREPRDVQAWIETANINRVQGNYKQALLACDQLNAFAGPFATAIARLPVMAATGKADDAYRRLGELLPEAKADYPSTTQWFTIMQAETAQALGRDDLAEKHWRDARNRAPDDKYVLRAYGEFLLDHDRADEALALVAGRPNDDGLLLCAALAAQRLGRDQDAARWQAELVRRFEEVRQRGDVPLGRFEARSVLLLEQDPPRALALALANWRVQKEVHDTRTVLEAAIAAHDPRQAQPVLQFLAENGARHAALDPLVEQLRRHK
jgi:tetratricopeptide (TPR) repeat protein